MEIRFDFDGVIARSIQAWLAQYHPDKTVDMVTEWNLWNVKELGVTKEQFFREFDNLNSKNIPIADGAAHYISLIRSLGHGVGIITSKTQNMLVWTLEFLDRHNLGDMQLEVTWYKECLPYEFLLDDSPVNYAKDPQRTVLFDRPWNQNVDATHRVKSFAEFYQFIANI